MSSQKQPLNIRKLEDRVAPSVCNLLTLPDLCSDSSGSLPGTGGVLDGTDVVPVIPGGQQIPSTENLDTLLRVPISVGGGDCSPLSVDGLLYAKTDGLSSIQGDGVLNVASGDCEILSTHPCLIVGNSTAGW